MANTAHIPMLPGNYPASAAERHAQQAEIALAIDFLETELEQLAREQHRLLALEAALHQMFQKIRPGLEQSYDLPVTELTAHAIHSFLADACRVIYGDPRAAAVLLPAGGPLTRSALMMALRQARAGLSRVSTPLSARQALLADRLAQARTVAAALYVAENGMGFVLRREVRGMGVEPHPAWFFDFESVLSQFNFQKLNRTEIPAYFSQGF